jgi:hypothetical protein
MQEWSTAGSPATIGRVIAVTSLASDSEFQRFGPQGILGGIDYRKGTL